MVGGGTGGTAAAIQAARRGAQTLLVSELPWLGGMLTSAGVAAPDGNELLAFQTGIWGAFLRSLHQQQSTGLEHGWVSFFTYQPHIGAQIFAQWVEALPHLAWKVGGVPLEVLRQDDRITGVRFAEFTVEAQIILDGTELGDLLALGHIAHYWGWEAQERWQEPSAPSQAQLQADPFYSQYPVQAPTWVVVLQDFGVDVLAPEIPPPPNWQGDALFQGAWENYGAEEFLNYGRLPQHRFMINWPIQGNDYGEGVSRLLGNATEQQAFLQESLWHSQGFAHFIQQQLGRHYGLTPETFPTGTSPLGGGAYGLHPYYRESRRVQGINTLREQDILPCPGGQTAPLPQDEQGRMSAIALGNYPNDHHYPSRNLALKPKSLRWGGRWTGTPFTIPYGCLIPKGVDGLLVCEKNISVSHIANGASRLQPVVLGIGQAAGMAAALCLEQGCQPRHLSVQLLQESLLCDPVAPAAIVPLFDLDPNHPDWLTLQRYYRDRPDAYPGNGCWSEADDQGLKKKSRSVTQVFRPSDQQSQTLPNPQQSREFVGQLRHHGEQDYTLEPMIPNRTSAIDSFFNPFFNPFSKSMHQQSQPSMAVGVAQALPVGRSKTIVVQETLLEKPIRLVTLCPEVDRQLKHYPQDQILKVRGWINPAGHWLRADSLETFNLPQ